MVGDTVTMGKLLHHAREVTCKTLDVRRLNSASIERKTANLQQNDYMGVMWSEFKSAYTRDRDDEVIVRPIMNQLSPEV